MVKQGLLNVKGALPGGAQEASKAYTIQLRDDGTVIFTKEKEKQVCLF